MVPSAAPLPDSDDPTPRKSTLFCWACGHASPADEGWTHRSRGAYETVACPCCDTAVDRRPTGGAPAIRPRPAERLARSYRRLVVGLVRVWRLGAAASAAAVPVDRSA